SLAGEPARRLDGNYRLRFPNRYCAGLYLPRHQKAASLVLGTCFCRPGHRSDDLRPHDVRRAIPANSEPIGNFTEFANCILKGFGPGISAINADEVLVLLLGGKDGPRRDTDPRGECLVIKR